MLYEPNEIKTSKKQLGKIFKQLEDSACLLGGWAVHHIVNKNLADIYALLWYSNTELPKLKNQLFSIYPEEEARKTVRTFTEEDINKVSQAIGASAKEISRILAELT
jgi:NACalpha-BTF3-like transcription factor